MKRILTKSSFRGKARGEKQQEISIRPRIELDLSWLSILATVFITVLAIYQLVQVFIVNFGSFGWILRLTQPILWIIILFYVYGGLVYQITRLGYIRRGIHHHPASLDELDSFRQDETTSLTILVPSYKEEERIVFNTLMSVALQDYPNKRVVLLIDDPPHPSTRQDGRKLTASRRLPARISNIFKGFSNHLSTALDDFIIRNQDQIVNHRRETATLASLYAEAAAWFEHQVELHPRVDHADELFIESVLQWHQHRHQQRAEELVRSLQDHYLVLPYDQLLKGYHQLVSLFTLEITSFERKRYENLSHESNKAMNLNSYLGLVGKSFQELPTGDRLHLKEVDPCDADFSVPDADFFITLDADSLITPDYALRLIHFMQQPENQHIAVAQTPYNSIPNAPTAIERIAGATTDIQYIIHQGFTEFDATYWVGANALLRKEALFDIAVPDTERGFDITRFIQDSTVIEDTESSIDLVARGWQLYNYPERLSFSATPPDFGSLIIQRRRWANGGLIILPKLRQLLKEQPFSLSLFAQHFMRIHYLVSITAVNLGLLLWLILPSADSFQTLWLPLTALPYFLLYTRDLRLLGYRRRDMLLVYALNLMLIPVNLAGVFKSIEQMVTKRKIPFGRTPKVKSRTAASPIFILMEYALFFYWFSLGLVDLFSGDWLDGAFGIMNAAFLIFAILRFVGLKESLQDLFPGLYHRIPSKRSTKSIQVSTLSRSLRGNQTYPGNQSS